MIYPVTPYPGPSPEEPASTFIGEARRLRDQFAVEAFKKLFWNEDGQPPRSEDTREKLARDSWLIADAMMKARGQ